MRIVLDLRNVARKCRQSSAIHRPLLAMFKSCRNLSIVHDRKQVGVQDHSMTLPISGAATRRLPQDLRQSRVDETCRVWAHPRYLVLLEGDLLEMALLHDKRGLPNLTHFQDAYHLEIQDILPCLPRRLALRSAYLHNRPIYLTLLRPVLPLVLNR